MATCSRCGLDLPDREPRDGCPNCGAAARNYSFIGSGGIMVGGEASYSFVRSYARAWLDDARRECQKTGLHARRREIVFSVCFCESYLLEWVRDEVLASSLERLEEFFPAARRTGVRARYKKVTEDLFSLGLLRSPFKTGDSHNENWIRLVKLRDGFVHASSSRPEGNQTSTKPVPTSFESAELKPGWAVRVAVEQAARLHRAAGTEPPAWLSVTASD
jgi:hypothetical protein